MGDAATDFMPDIESSVKCLLYWDQNKGWETGLLWLPSSLRISSLAYRGSK